MLHAVTRRTLLALLASGTMPAWPQPAGRTWRIGFLGVGRPEPYASRIAALRQGLKALGYEEGRNLVLEFRWAESQVDRLPGLAAELVGSKIDLLITHSTAGALAGLKATTTVPIVMADSGDPVAQGIVTNLARPGGNITGSSLRSSPIFAKRLELLREIQPGLRRAAFVVNAAVGVTAAAQQLKDMAARYKIELEPIAVAGPDEFEQRLAEFKSRRGEAVLMMDDPLFVVHMARVANAALKHRLALAGFVDFVEHGGLIGYGANFPELYRRAATFVDKILRGARPGDLPIEQASRFELHVNAKTARALGLQVPQDILLRADRVVE